MKAIENQTYEFLDNYEDINAIKQKFNSLSKINEKCQFKDLDSSRFFIIRTQGEDNVHRAMKYGIWTSTAKKNLKLSEAFKSVKEQGSVYLFFTEVSSMCFSGIAKLTSDFDEHSHFKYWLIENRWFGSFRIQWLFVKDIPFKEFQQCKIVGLNEYIDGSELEKEIGIKIAELYENYEYKQSLFEDFILLDKLELKCRQERQNNERFEKKFKELRTIFESNPFTFSVVSYERKRQKKQYYNQQTFYQFQQTPQYWQTNNGFYQYYRGQ